LKNVLTHNVTINKLIFLQQIYIFLLEKYVIKLYDFLQSFSVSGPRPRRAVFRV
jgi:hypothetical protein